MDRKINVFIVDDNDIFRRGLSMVIENTDYAQVVAAASSGKEFLHKMDSTDFDIVLMDINMPFLDGIKTTMLAVRNNPIVKIAALTMFGEEDYIQKMIGAGAKGFILKNIKNAELEIALKSIHEGKSYFSQEMLDIIINRISNNFSKKPIIKLTKREHEVLQLIAQERSTEEIADELSVSISVVESDQANLLQKTESKNTVNLIFNAISHQLIDNQ